MSTNNMKYTLEQFMKNSSIIKDKGLSPEEVSTLVQEYHDSVEKSLLEYGYVQVNEDLRLEIVRLKKRNHVLRGQSYTNWRKYKIKAKMSYPCYERIDKSFSELEGGI